MESLILQETKSSPAIAFDSVSGILEISGESYPENSYEFYKPVLAWISRFCANFSGPIVFNCRISYLNTGSTKSMMDIFDLFEDRFRKGLKIRVNWFCDSENDRAVETAEEFMEDVTFPFEIKPLVGNR
jgi:hypothetical protein